MANTSKTAETKIRVDEIYKLMLCGAGRRDIFRHAEKNEWNLKSRRIDELIHMAKEELAEVQESEHKASFGTALKRLDMLFYLSMGINDFKTAHAVEKTIINLHGLDKTNINHTIEVNHSNELRDLIDKAIAADPTCRDRITSALETDEEEET